MDIPKTLLFRTPKSSRQEDMYPDTSFPPLPAHLTVIQSREGAASACHGRGASQGGSDDMHTGMGFVLV